MHNFFLHDKNKQMATDMDQFCTIVIVIGGVILVFMGFGEITRINSRSNPSVCGRAAAIENTPKPANARSAKRSFANGGLTTEKINDQVGKYLSLSDEWPNETAEEDMKHKELKQDATALNGSFTWEASSDDNKKFEALKIDPEKVRKTANTKALNPESQIEEPTYSRTRGLANPMLNIYHGCGKNDEVKFGNSCTWFSGTDAYYHARKKTAQCDCLREDCDACKSK